MADVEIVRKWKNGTRRKRKGHKDRYEGGVLTKRFLVDVLSNNVFSKGTWCAVASSHLDYLYMLLRLNSFPASYPHGFDPARDKEVRTHSIVK